MAIRTFREYPDSRVSTRTEALLVKITQNEIIVKFRGRCNQTFDIPDRFMAIPYRPCEEYCDPLKECLKICGNSRAVSCATHAFCTNHYRNRRPDVIHSFKINMRRFCDGTNSCDQDCYYNYLGWDQYIVHVLVFSDRTVQLLSVSANSDEYDGSDGSDDSCVECD